MGDPKTYTLRTETLIDLCSVPFDRRAECFSELAEIVIHFDAIRDGLKLAGAEGEIEWPPSIEWVDDERGEVVSNLVTRDGDLIVSLKNGPA